MFNTCKTKQEKLVDDETNKTKQKGINYANTHKRKELDEDKEETRRKERPLTRELKELGKIKQWKEKQ